ncbi:uncharacterized protein [Aegilops tauschii subsp. strangulata]|uniref:uncharacterized protein n=1 Tax=Aegilops tauschii subsp. strangulata TaxID=200361 RepID=UPI00098A7B2A|nr:uncharacterized protein LOC109756512 [Aegilops tauschii subsp. strangulata]
MLMKVVVEQAAERERLGNLQKEVTEAQASHDKHVFELTARLGAREKKILVDIETKVAADRGAFSCLEFRARQATQSICKGGFEDPLSTPEDSNMELSSKFITEHEGVAAKVDFIPEDECCDLFSVAAMSVFSHIYLGDPSFDFYAVIGPIPRESRAVMAEALEGHVAALLGKFTRDIHISPARAEAGGINGGNGPSS